WRLHRRLELCPNSQLNDARVTSRRELPELAVDLGAARIEPRRRIVSAELRVVECVVELRPELEAESFANFKILKERHVKVIEARTPEQHLGHSSQSSGRGYPECLRSEIPAEGALVFWQIGVAHHQDAR